MLHFDEYCQLMTEEFFAKMILGDAAIVKTLGIITAENPGIDNKLTKIGNERKNKVLQADLEKRGFAPVQIKGKFAGMQGNPFLVININREQLMELAKKYKQHAVIFGEKYKKGIEFSYIENGRTSRRGALAVDQPENLIDRDCYFTLGQHKYNIRFTK